MNLKVELVGTKIDYAVTESAQFLSRMIVRCPNKKYFCKEHFLKTIAMIGSHLSQQKLCVNKYFFPLAECFLPAVYA